ncbi:MAG: hypothetical protein J0H08_08770 [Rhizobiales bacterium]|nr:hypothetical protein [Hyphomicrobiales bacterium]
MDDHHDEFVAAKPFNLVNRHIAKGEVITRAEVEGGERDFAALRGRGFIVGYDTKAADKAARQAAEAGTLIIADSPSPTPPPPADASRAAGDPGPTLEPRLKRPSRRA